MDAIINEIALSIKGSVISGDPTARVKGFSIDSRTLEQGDLFIAVRGDNFDAHDFIAEAVSKGAAGIVVSDTGKIKDGLDTNVIKVGSTNEALKRTAGFIRGKFTIPFICVTGTNGKTTVKDILKQVLSFKYNVLSSKNSFNNMFGVALTLFELKKEHEVAIFEIGTNAPGEIAELASILAPQIGVITNIGYGHIAGLKNIEGVFREKVSLLDNLRDNGMVVVNNDDVFLSKYSHPFCLTRRFGTGNGSDFFISGISKKDDGYSFLINGQEYFIPVYGRHNVYNAAAAICVADHMGVDHLQIKDALKRITLPEMRLSRVMAGNILFINDAYNANPNSFISALNSVKFDVTAPKKGVIAGDMLELGEVSEEQHSIVGKKIAELKMDFFIAMGPGAAIMADSAVFAGMPIDKIRKVSSHKEAAIMLKEFADKDSAVLLKGSRKNRMEEIITCFMNYSTI